MIQSMQPGEGRVGHNERLLAVMGQSGHDAAIRMYGIGAVLFLSYSLPVL